MKTAFVVAATAWTLAQGQNADVVDALKCQNTSGPFSNLLTRGQFATSTYFDCFRPQEQMLGFMDAMMGIMPREMVTKFNISTTFLGRQVPAYKISAGGNKSTVLVLSLHHAREWISGAAAVYSVATLLDDWTNNSSNSTLSRFNSLYDWVFVPIVNLDGYITTWTTEERLRRKNMNPLDITIPYDATRDISQSGVDLNRNYGPAEYFNLEPAAKSNLSYPGPYPFSEPETKGIHTWLQANPQVIGALDIHSYAGMLLTPFGDVPSGPDAPFDAKFTTLGQNMQSAILRETGTLYPTQPEYKLYMAYGTFTDYFFRIYGKPTVTFEIKGKSFIVSPTSIRNGGDHLVSALKAFSNGLATFMADLPPTTPTPAVTTAPGGSKTSSAMASALSACFVVVAMLMELVIS
ncbi:hypothetical protein AeMF1_009466 [Aphanomyces euteiches]|nr:hypothetical protein AeMF1_009466 [Aphanomyces euteiches]KAH9182941.1 hypothetical protein AeNC1_015080 [Aphanomyces euteiches]